MSNTDNIKQMEDDHTYSKHETNIMNYWKDKQIYEKITDKNKDGEQFHFMDGPPFVSSNSLHFGHLMIGFLKSTVLNYNQMIGKNCLNELGYDCHGLPIEMVANKQLGVSTKKEVEEYGIDKYNASCKEMINKFSGAWTPIYERIGRWANFKKTYKTMDTNFMESVWWVFAELWKKNLIYKGHQVMPYSNACNSPLSNFEAGQNYKDIETKSVYVLFRLKGCISSNDTYMVAWTTTPWTLPSNLALCVNYEAIYDWVEFNNKVYIIAQNFTKNLDIKVGKVINSCKGKDLVGLEYEPVFNYMSDFPSENKFTVIADYKNNFVSVEPSNVGTGIVHLAPYYGEDDFRVCQENNITDNKSIDKSCTIDDNGKFIDEITEFANKLVTDKETNDEIIKNLKIKGLILRTQVYTHSYPFCYRTDTPLIYKVNSSYFVKVTSLKDDLLANNEKVTWHPSSIGSGRFKSWLENVKDWGVSRNRFFGTPIPIWVSDDGEESVCISSIDELTKLANLPTRINDLHRETIDNIEIPSKMGKGMLKNVRLVLDCWFESGCVPVAQLHYPFENSEIFDSVDYLSEFIAEGLDQTRGWFYTLMVISTALFNKPAFKNVICTGLILDENGLKFSKKYGNFKDPFMILDKYGADATRMYLLTSPTIYANPLFFNETSIEKLKQRIIPYINAVKLILTHIKDYQSKGNALDINLWKDSKNITDKWITSITADLVFNVSSHMENYRVDKAIDTLINHVEDLTNWYIKLNRDRIRGLSGNNERGMSLSVLYNSLMTYIKVSAPFMPFLSEHLYDHLKIFASNPLESVHLYSFPKFTDLIFDENSVSKFNILKDVIRNIRIMRNTLPSHTSMKIPLYKAIIFHNDSDYIETVKFFEDTIKEEVNCVDIEYNDLENNLVYKIVPNSKSLGKKFRSELNKVRERLIAFSSETVSILHKDCNSGFSFDLDDKTYKLEKEDYTIEMVPASEYKDNPNMVSRIDNELMIAIDKRYTEELHNIYQTHRLGTWVQRLRKTTSLNPWNKIFVNFECSNSVQDIINSLKRMMMTRLQCDIMVNQIIDKVKYASGTYDFEFFDELKEEINFTIYLV
jgi:isoleucyl-tRNA synthetase